jgi:GT2 family glycosyltransferase
MRDTEDFSIVFATLNQLHLTKAFIDSLKTCNVDFNRVSAVDNGSTDGTIEYLKEQNFGSLILNRKNLGCGTAWNQGILAIESEWCIVMNNDVLCQPGWPCDLLSEAVSQNLSIASPAMLEGDHDATAQDFLAHAGINMNSYTRHGQAHAVCMAIHQSVFEKIGYFMPVPSLGGLEDAIFFRRAKEEELGMGIVGQSWIHHFGSATVKALKLKYDTKHLGDRKLMRRYLGESYLEMKINKLRRKFDSAVARKYEIKKFGHSVWGSRKNGQTNWAQ